MGITGIAGKLVWSGGKGKQNLTEFFSSALYGVGWLIPDCARPTRAFLLFLLSLLQSRMERMRVED
jgi:hypothetical protein